MEYTEKDVVKIAKRENNTKRNYMVVDQLQGKHIPVVPSKALDLFAALADTFREKYKDEKLLLVGFAETATAIGAQAAITVGADYIQTTREVIPGVNYLFFSEEFMFPALYIGRKMEKEGAEVRCHSTTRSPIAVSLEKEYPLHSRYELKSLYDPDRRTFIYDIGKYDKVLIVTDSPEIKESQETLINAVRMQNKDITVVRWC